MYPKPLPGGKGVLFTKFRFDGSSEIAVIDLETRKSRTVFENARYANYLPTGHLVYRSADPIVFAVRFDVDKLSTRGLPVPVLDNVFVTVGFSFSTTGTLVFLQGSTATSLVWVNREGKTERVKEIEPSALYPRSSSAGGRVAISVASVGGRRDIWVYHPSRDVLTRLTFGGINLYPVWSPDDERIVYASLSGEGSTLFSVQANGIGEPETLLTSEGAVVPSSWSPDGQTIWLDAAFEKSYDIWSLRLDAKGKPQPFLESEFDEFRPMISPEGSWLAYVSNESGEFQVYVHAMSSSGGKWQISTSGGDDPVWSSNGKKLFYRNGNKWMSVEVETQPEFRAGNPVVLFEGAYEGYYDVTPGADQFILVKNEFAAAQNRIQVVTNWFEEVKRLVPSN
jgi:Tol biopolymer transport system component